MPNHKCTAKTCKLPVGSVARVDYKFVAKEDSEILAIRVKAYDGHQSFFIIDGEDACKSLYTVDGNKTSCPVKKDQAYVTSNYFYVSPNHEKVSI